MKTNKTFLFMVVLTALLVRVIFVSALGPKLHFPDSESYTTMGGNFLDGKGLIISEGRKIERMPLYPLFIAGCYRICDFLRAETENDHDNPLRILFVRLAQCFVGAVTCLLVFLLGKRLFNPFTGQIAAFITAIYPFFVFYTGLVLTETLFIALLAASLLSLVKLQEKPSVLLAIITGAFMGAAILTRASLLLFLPFVIPFWIIGCPPRRKLVGFAYLLLAWLTVGATMAPWVYRNYEVTRKMTGSGHLVLTTLMAGPSLYEANWRSADGGPQMDEIPWEEAGEKNEYEVNRYYRSKAWEYIRHKLRNDPKGYLGLSLTKLGRFWNPILNDEKYSTIPHNLISISSFLPLFLLGLFGLLKTLKQPRVLLILISPILYYSIIHSIFVGSTRYRTPVMPFVILFAGFAIDSILSACYRGKIVTPEGAAPRGGPQPEEDGTTASPTESEDETEAPTTMVGKRKGGLLKRVGVTLINAVLIIITLCCIIFTVLASPYNVKREAQKQLSKYFGARTTIESAGFSLFNGIHLSGIKVALPTESGETEILKIGSVEVEHNLEGLASLKALVFNREVSIQGVKIYSLEFNLTRDKQGHWNIEPVFGRTSGGHGGFKPKSIPKIALHSSALHFRDEMDKIPSFDLSGAKVDLIPLRGQGRGFNLIAHCELSDLGELKIAGEIYTNTPRANLKVTAKNIPINDRIRSYLPSDCQTMWDWFKPENGAVNVTFNVEYGNSAETPQEKIDYDLALDFSDCDAVFKQLPYPLKKSKGRLRFTREGVKIEKFTASNGEAGVKVEGGLDGYGKDAGIDVMIYAHDVPLDKMLKDVLSRSIAGFQKVSDFYGFTGGIINVDSWHLTRDKGPDKPINHVIEVSFKDCSMNCEAFPYPIKNGAGKLRLTRSSVAIDGIEASDSTGRSKINIGGRLDGYGEDAGIEITVEADSIVLDEALKNALPKNIRELWSFFNPTGSVKNVTWQLTRKKGPKQEPTHFLEASLTNGTMRCNDFEYTVSEITSKVFYENGVLLLKDLKGRNDKAKINIGSPKEQDGKIEIGDVRIDTSQADPSFDIVIDVKNAQADERLKAALREKYQEIWDQFKPSGTFDARCEVKRPEPGGAANVTVYADLLGCSATYAGFAYPLSDITGEIIFRSDTLTADMKNIVGRHGDAKITLLDTTVGALSEKELKISGTAKNLMLNDALRGALPAKGREMWAIFDPKGLVDVDWEYTRKPGVQEGTYKIGATLRDVDMRYRLTATSKEPVRLANMRGKITFDGEIATLKNVTGQLLHGSAVPDEIGSSNTVTLNGEIHNPIKGRRASLEVKAEGIQLTDDLKSALPESAQGKWQQMAPIAGQVSFLINVDWRMGTPTRPQEAAYDARVSLKHCNLTVEIPIDDLTGEINLENGRILDGDFLNPASVVEGNVALHSFTVQGIHFGKFSAKFAKEGDSLRVSKLNFGSHGGSGAGMITFTFMREDGKFKDVEYFSNLSVQDVEVDDVVRSARLSFKKLKGKLDGEASLRGKGLERESLESHGSFQIKDGDISEFKKRVLPDSVAKITSFTDAELKYEIEDDQIKAKRLNLKGPGLSLYGTGRMNIKEGDLEFIFRPVRGKTKIPFFDIVARLLEQTWVRVTVEGTWKEHTWQVDPLFPLTRIIRGIAGLFSSGKKGKTH